MIKLIIAALVALATSANAAQKPVIGGSCQIKGGVITGHCQVVPPVKIPTSPKPGKVEKSK